MESRGVRIKYEQVHTLIAIPGTQQSQQAQLQCCWGLSTTRYSLYLRRKKPLNFRGRIIIRTFLRVTLAPDLDPDRQQEWVASKLKRDSAVLALIQISYVLWTAAITRRRTAPVINFWAKHVRDVPGPSVYKTYCILKVHTPV